LVLYDLASNCLPSSTPKIEHPGSKGEIIMADIEVERPVILPAIANPAPLGLCAFALTTFVLSAANAKLYDGPQIVLGLALFYGGLAQMLAGMWEFKTGNTFGATAFTSYGAFWMAFAATIYFKLVPPGNGIGFFLIGWTVFTGIMLLASLRTSVALVLLFALLFVTFLLLSIGVFTQGSTDQMAGYCGLATAAVAWYTAAAGLMATGRTAFTLPIGVIK
jgi:succinate-acetate transporter protein